MPLRPISLPPVALDPRVAKAALGDRTCAETLLLELLPRVRNLVRYLAWGDVDVDDISQLALIEIGRSFHNYRGEGALHSWADRITTRVALHYLRKRRNEERRRTALAPELRIVAPNSEQPDDYTLRRHAVQMLDDLPDEQRQAVVMHHVVGLSVPELAHELGIPFETARSRLRLGVQKLRDQIRRGGAS
jgi:RNA polymerase sigma-70 factor (ECF subfamily)